MTEETAEREVIVSRLVDAPREAVFAAFTEREHVMKWWLPEGSEVLEYRAEPGGQWRYSQPGEEGESYPFKITFVEMDRPSSLVYDFQAEGAYASDPVRTHVSFEEEGGKTRVRLQLVYATAEQMEQSLQYGAKEGAAHSLKSLAQYLEKEMQATGDE